MQYKNLKRKALIIGKPCIWSIISVLAESENKTINITALVAKTNSNYRTVMKCIDYMKKLQIVEVIVMDRLRLIRLLDSPLAKLMLEVIRSVKG